MKPAEYFATGNQDYEDYFHYALGVKYYTHFTSPIRRYADVVTHRLLQASLTPNPEVEKLESDGSIDTYDQTLKISKTCNEKKKAARLAQEASSKLFLCLCLERFFFLISFFVFSFFYLFLKKKKKNN